MSFGSTNFKNDTLRLVAKGLKVPHYFIVSYIPWSYGTVKLLRREFLRVFRSVISELQIGFEEWYDLLPIFQSVLNNFPSPQRVNVSLITALVGSKPTPPINTFIQSCTVSTIALSNLQFQRAFNISSLQNLCETLGGTIQSKSTLETNRKQSRDLAAVVVSTNLSEGDFSLIVPSDFHAGVKLALHWRIPTWIVKALNHLVYRVEYLRNGLM